MWPRMREPWLIIIIIAAPYVSLPLRLHLTAFQILIPEEKVNMNINGVILFPCGQIKKNKVSCKPLENDSMNSLVLETGSKLKYLLLGHIRL